MNHTKTLLDAARKAYPESEWWISVFDKVCSNNSEFCLSCGDDQMALQIALEREGWFFGFKEDFGFMGSFDGGTFIDEHNAPTKPDLLLAIVRQGG